MNEKCYTLTESQIESLKAEAKADTIEKFADLLKEKVDEDGERFNIYPFTCIDEVAEQLKEN